MSNLISQNTMFQLFLLLKFTTIFFSMVYSFPPEDPIMCSSGNRNCTITNAYGAFSDRSVCKAADVAYPTTEEELISVVAKATKANRKMKVATRYSHSMPKLVCPDGDEGLLISTKLLNRKLDVDLVRMTITVDSGVTLEQLLDEAAKAGLVLPILPYAGFFSIGGMLGSGTHGSTLLGEGSSIEAYVIQIRIVTPAGPEEGYSKVRTLVSSDPDLKAARLSLGVLGVISQVTLKLEPLFKRSITYSVNNDVDLANQVTRFGYQHEFGVIIWHPSQQKVVYQIDDRVSTNVTGNGVFEQVSIRSMPLTKLAIIRTAEEDQEMTGDADGKCTDAKIATSELLDVAFGLTNNGTVFSGYPVIGYNNLMGASRGCAYSPNDDQKEACPWDPRVKGQFYHNTAFSISMAKVKSFVQDMQKLNELVPKGLCAVDLNMGIFLRYVTASTAYLGKQEAYVEFDIVYYRSKDPMTPRLYEDILEEIEQIGVFKYGGLPHWGKNRNMAFEDVIKKYGNVNEFLKVKEKYDPLGLFSSNWTDEVLGLRGKVTIEREGCALEGLCVCSKDIHCAPSKGYFCRQGKVYEKARVCAR